MTTWESWKQDPSHGLLPACALVAAVSARMIPGARVGPDNDIALGGRLYSVTTEACAVLTAFDPSAPPDDDALELKVVVAAHRAAARVLRKALS